MSQQEQEQMKEDGGGVNRQMARKQDSRDRNESASDKIWWRALKQPEGAIKLPSITVLRVSCFLGTVVLNNSLDIFSKSSKVGYGKFPSLHLAFGKA